jgi:hypothetical protein
MSSIIRINGSRDGEFLEVGPFTLSNGGKSEVFIEVNNPTYNHPCRVIAVSVASLKALRDRLTEFLKGLDHE